MGAIPWMLAAALVASEGGRRAGAADLVLRHGHVWAGKGRPEGTAIAVKDERVLFVGSDEGADPWADGRTRVVDLRGRLVVPGFNDAHVHFLSGGFGLLSVDLRPARDEDDFVRRIAAHARTLPAGTWLREGNWDHEAWPSRALPTRRLLDRIQILPLQILDQRKLKNFEVAGGAKNHRHLRQPKFLGRAPAAFASNDFVLPANFANNQRLNNAVLAN